MTPRRRGAALAVVALSIAVTGCGGGDGDGDETALDRSSVTTASTATTTTTTTPTPTSLGGADGALPPRDPLALAPSYGERLAALGLRLTDRGGLIDRSDGYQPSAEGTHLALYVEPIGELTAEQYVDGLGTVTVLFSDVFDRWPGLESFDVCQEPAAAVDGSDEPLPVTQIDMSRSQAAAFDWPTVTAVDIVRASQAEPPGITLRVSPALADEPAYRAVVEDAASPP